jgi:nicotinic acid mononucleotide adenylyltransferase
MNTSYKKLSDYSLRAQMVEILFQADSGIILIPEELNGSEYELWDFPQQIGKIHPDAQFFSIVGTDTLNWLATQKTNESFRKVTLLVNERAGIESSGAGPEGVKVHYANLGNLSYSSSAIRKELLAGVRPKSLPDDVLGFILKHKMYNACSHLLSPISASY